MKLEDQVCSFLQADRLYELGIIQNSLFYYTQSKTPTNPNLAHYGYRQSEMPVWISYDKQSVLSGSNIHIELSAFSVAELGLMLPRMVGDLKLVQWHIASNDSRWALSYGIQYRYKDTDPVHHGTFPMHCVFGDTEAKARAELLICLLTDGKVTAEECNKRLTDK